MQQAFVLDLNKCTGCQACGVACANENQLEAGTSWRTVDTYNAPRYAGLPLYHLSLACNHCVDPPCMNHCPALAYSKDDATGAVTIDPDSCIGCKYCTWACPYDAPRFDVATGVVSKCTFCNHRLAAGERPACVSQCPTGALQIADLDTAPGVADVPGFPRTEVGPALRFIPLREGRQFPESIDPGAPAEEHPLPARKVTLRSEWPLLVFSLLVPALVGLMAAPNASGRVNIFVFAGLAATAMGASTFHLGRKRRAWRAVLNWRGSWLSREIILFSAFAGMSALCLLLGAAAPGLNAATAVVGFAALFAVDNVYEVTRTPRLRMHSARAVTTGAMVAALVSGAGNVLIGVLAVKFALYIHRHVGAGRARVPLWLAATRVVVGIVLPVGAWLGGYGGVALTACLAVGEIIDRGEFYLELDVPTPRRQIALDLSLAQTIPAAAPGGTPTNPRG